VGQRWQQFIAGWWRRWQLASWLCWNQSGCSAWLWISTGLPCTYRYSTVDYVYTQIQLVQNSPRVIMSHI